ncbi:MAG: amylo-alpha-1,6-glucosidase [Candidatus Woesearchaeota archaeon]
MKQLDDDRTARIKTMAIRTLNACTTPIGIVAGASHFSQVWTRDACFALWGSLTLNDYDTVRISLEHITDMVDDIGRVPLRIGTGSMTYSFLRAWYYKKLLKKDGSWFKENITIKHGALYHDDKKRAYALDSGLLLIIGWALAKEMMPSKEYEIMATEKRISFLEKLYEHYRNYENYGLLYQYPYGDWADSIRRIGYSSYVNSLYYAATKGLSKIIPEKKEHYDEKAIEIKSLINKRLWKNTHYADFTNADFTPDNFSVDANMLPLLFGITDDKKAKLVLSRLNSYPELISKPGLTVQPYYDNRHISGFIRLIGMKNYHNGMQWLWLSAIMLLALSRTKDNTASEMIDKTISSIDKLLEDNKNKHPYISEVYYNGKPFANFYYESEEPFAWSSGMLISALDNNKRLVNAIKKITG